MPLKIRARAKINLCLEVDGIRPDGYHALWGVMHAISLYDPLVMRKSNSPRGGLILHSKAALPEDNTFVRAYNAFINAYPETARGAISLRFQKRIPSQAGLGGASADAAGMLKALHKMFSVSDEKIMELGAQVGSDVPFCLIGGCALAEGRGEILTPLRENTPLTHVLLVKCERGVATGELFRRYDEEQKNQPHESIEERDQRRARLIDAATRIDGPDFAAFRKYARNDLEKTVFSLLPEVETAKTMLYDMGADFALMTGSGSTVFGVFSDVSAMKKAQIKIKRRGYPFVHGTELL